MIRVLAVIKGLGRGGAEQLLVSALPYADSERFEYEFAYLLPWKNALVEELERTGKKVHCLDGARGLGWLVRLRRLLKERPFDVIHVHSPVAAIGVRLALGFSRSVRILYTEHNLWDYYHPATRVGNMLTFFLNDHVLAVSDHVRASMRYPRMLRFLPMPGVETLYHGLDFRQLTGWGTGRGVREEFQIPEGAPVVGTVANFRPQKGYEDLLDAAREVRESVPEVRFLLVGSGPLEEPMKKRAQALGLVDAVIFAGFREDAPKIAAAFDVFALSSRYEGLSIALVEAMALGKPSVVTGVGGVPEVIQDGQQGLVVGSGDSRGLAEGLVRLLQDEETHNRMGRAASRRASRFDIRKTVARTEQIYSGLTS